MNKINHPWILFFMMICAVVMVWSNDDSKLDHKAAGYHSITNADPNGRQKVLKGLRGISSLRRAQKARRSETSLYRACVWTCNSLGAGTPGKVLIDVVTSDEENWGDYVVLSKSGGFSKGDCLCGYFQKPTLTSVLSYDLIVKLIDSNGNQFKPQGFALSGPSHNVYCEYREQCGFSCWLSEEYPKRVTSCWNRAWPSCS